MIVNLRIQRTKSGLLSSYQYLSHFCEILWWRDAADYLGFQLLPGCPKIGNLYRSIFPENQAVLKKWHSAGADVQLASSLIKAYFSRANGEEIVGKIDSYVKKSSLGGMELGLDSDFDEVDYDEANPDTSEGYLDSFIDDNEEHGWDSTDDESDCGKKEDDEEDWELDASGQCYRIILNEDVEMDATDDE